MTSERNTKIVAEMPEMPKIRRIAQHVVVIKDDGSTTPTDVDAGKKDGDQIIWHQPKKRPYTVYFPVSPFSQQRFDAPNGEDMPSGPIKSEAGVGYYPYYITIGATSADPGVNIKP